MEEIKFKFWIDGYMTSGIDLKNIFYYQDQVMNNVIRRYSGVKDKDGIEIYEGDLISFGDYKKYEIEYYSGSFGYTSGYSFVTLVDTNKEMIEVVGNIHEKY